MRTRIPLVLHGASGIPAEELVKAAAMNVGKVNFNTELRTGVLAVLEEQTAAHRADGENLQGLLGHWDSSARAFARISPGDALPLTSRAVLLWPPGRPKAHN